MDNATYKLVKALEKEGFSSKKIDEFLREFDLQLHAKVIEKLMEDGHPIEDAELLYQKAKSIIEEEDQEVVLNLINEEKQKKKGKKPKAKPVRGVV